MVLTGGLKQAAWSPCSWIVKKVDWSPVDRASQDSESRNLWPNLLTIPTEKIFGSWCLCTLISPPSQCFIWDCKLRHSALAFSSSSHALFYKQGGAQSYCPTDSSFEWGTLCLLCQELLASRTHVFRSWTVSSPISYGRLRERVPCMDHL